MNSIANVRKVDATSITAIAMPQKEYRFFKSRFVHSNASVSNALIRKLTINNPQSMTICKKPT
jgi:hypothetical protein